MENRKIKYFFLIALSMIIFACVYIVLPEGVELREDLAEDIYWEGLATNIFQTEGGDLHIDLTVHNNTGDWSTMHAIEGTPAVIAYADGKTANCDTVNIGTGGHRLAPGFQMRGYMTEQNGEAQVQLLFVECAGIESSDGGTLTIQYKSYQGERNDYEPDKNEVAGKMVIDLDNATTDLTYPIADTVEGLNQEPTANFLALSDNEIALADVERNDDAIIFTWENFNPTSFALKTHIGIPPVIGSDGIIYGVYETIDLAPVPLTPPKEKITWNTEVAVPKNITGFYVLLSVESKTPRTYINYVIDISDL
jgi:hypothetical protein